MEVIAVSGTYQTVGIGKKPEDGPETLLALDIKRRAAGDFYIEICFTNRGTRPNELLAVLTGILQSSTVNIQH
jgi:hypothetical protein